MLPTIPDLQVYTLHFPFHVLIFDFDFCFDAVEVPFPHWVHHLPASSSPYSWTHGSSDEKRSLVNRALRTMTKTLGEIDDDEMSVSEVF